MARRLRCRDAGFECDEVIRGETEDEVMREAAAHAREAHGVPEITPELEARVRAGMTNA